MKIRVTLLTENGNHLDESISTEYVEACCKAAWEVIMERTAEPGERCVVESCEVVER